MLNTKCKKFKGEIENYLRNSQNQFECKIDRLFTSLKIKTWLCRTNIIKKDGYPASHLLFVLFMLPLLKLNNIHCFCSKGWKQWSHSSKDHLRITPLSLFVSHLDLVKNMNLGVL